MLTKLNFNGKEANVDISIKLRETNWKIDLSSQVWKASMLLLTLSLKCMPWLCSKTQDYNTFADIYNINK